MIRLAALAAGLALASGVAAAPSLSDSSLAVSNYLSATNPTGIRFTGPNEGFLIEKAGAVKHFAGGAVTTVLNVPVATNSERGLLGIAVDPQFATNKFVYLYYSAGIPPSNWVANRLQRYTWNASSKTLVETPLPFPQTFGSAADGLDDGPNHNGGPLRFGPDGKLYGITGDLDTRNRAEQNNKSNTDSAFTGGIFRLNTDGSVPADNPLTGAADPLLRRWYAYGVRNSFGLAFDPVTGNLWDTENGPTSMDEINRVPAGMNSGWRAIQGPDSRDEQNAPADLLMLPGAVYQDPQFTFASPIGITSIAFLSGSAWGSGYDDAVLIGENNFARLHLFRLNAARSGFVLSGNLADQVFDAGDTPTTFGTGFSVVTDIQVGPDGAVYIASLGADTIYRVAPIPEPQTWVLVLAGLALVGWAARRRATLRRGP